SPRCGRFARRVARWSPWRPSPTEPPAPAPRSRRRASHTGSSTASRTSAWPNAPPTLSTMAAVIVIVVLVVVLGIIFAALYNGLIKLRNVVQESWAQIDVELKRRHDLIGNLVETVKGYAAHERGTLDEVTRARAAAMTPNQTPAQAAQTEGELTRALVNLQAVSEAYPDLKANQNFMALQNELSS